VPETVPDNNFGNSDTRVLTSDDAPVRTASENATAGDGVAIDGRHDGLWKKERRLIKAMKCRKELADIGCPARTQSFQVNSCREYSALSGQHHRLGIRLAQIEKARGKRVTEFNIEGIGPAMRHGQHRDVVDHVAINHAACSAGFPCGARATARCESRSA
jgi:hypothetical protein